MGNGVLHFIQDHFTHNHIKTVLELRRKPDITEKTINLAKQTDKFHTLEYAVRGGGVSQVVRCTES